MKKRQFFNGDFRLNFPSALHKATATDSYRPVFNNIIFQNGYAYATDAHILVRQSLWFINIEGYENLNGKRMHAQLFQRIYNEKNVIVRAFVDYIEVEYLLFGNSKIKYSYSTDDSTAPNFEAIIPEIGKSVQPPTYSTIGINPRIFSRLISAMKINNDIGAVIIHLPERNTNSIIVIDKDYDNASSDQVGLIMPVHVGYDHY